MKEILIRMQTSKEQHGNKIAFLSNQCKEKEENKRMGKTRDLVKKIRYPGNISGKEGLNKGQKF